tara:strand:+ start:3407 stop:4114 length:708 start_codon:yes stop_codon:yes gene_type:complete
MRYLFRGLLSLLLISCHSASYEVCSDTSESEQIQIARSTTRIAGDSRRSTVKVYAERPKGRSVGTGTILSYKGKTIILTAAHVVGDWGNHVTVSTGGQFFKTSVRYLDTLNDMAVLVVKEDMRVKPIKLRAVSKRNVEIGTDVVYSGYPNNSSLLTIEGYIAGVHPKGYVYMHSYGWSGASGSSVFDSKGRLVGILIALEVGEGFLGMPDIIEDVVIIVPIWKLNFDLLDMNLSL